MLKISTSSAAAAFFWPVRIPQAVADGRVEHSQIQIQFRRFNREQLASLGEEAKPAPDAPPLSGEEALDRDTDYVLKIASGWKDVDVDGDSEFSRDNLRTVLNAYPMAGAKIVEAFWHAHNGEAARKN